MGQQQSKDELLYQQVSYGNVEGIKSLARDGAGLEYLDKDLKTPLILASMNPELNGVAKTLIELGANVNAYRPGRHAGTPLHHAAKRGLQNTVMLLLSHGANALIMNDDCQTPLDVAREKGHANVVRAIENHICLFSGWMREFYGFGFLETWAPQLVWSRVWVVIVPSGSRNPTKPFKLELAIYTGAQDAQPQTIIALWKANLEEPKSSRSDLSVTIVHDEAIPKGRRKRRRRRCRPRIPSQTRTKFAPEKDGDKQQLERFCNACKGIPQAHPVFLHGNQLLALPATAPPNAEDLELAMAISASIQLASEENPPLHANMTSEASTSNAPSSSTNTRIHDLGASKSPAPLSKIEGTDFGPSSSGTNQDSDDHTTQSTNVIASAPPISDDGPIQYPSIDSTPIDISPPAGEGVPAKGRNKMDEGGSSSCVICLDAPVEGACIPCGHMAGCMSCLNEIKGKKWGCPVCRAKIEQVVRLYAV